MNRLGTALLAAIEAVVTVGVGIGIALVPLTLLWGFEYGLQVDWDVFWKATGSVWLIGHGVDVSFVLGAALAKSSGVGGATDPIHVTLAALGFALVTAWLAGRAGRRFAETEHRTTGLLVGTGVVAVLGLAVALSSRSAATQPTLWQAVVLPALWFAIPAWWTSEVCRRRRGLPADPVTQLLLDQVSRVPAAWRAVAAFGLRAGTAATAAVVAVAGIVVAVLVFTSFAEVISLYEQSHAGIVGGVALTVGQLAFLPDFVGWATSWLVGPGFAIGTGSSVSPIGTTLGPIPGIPVFGALPAAGHAFGLVWVLVPVIAGFAVGGLLRPRLVEALGRADTALHRAMGGVAAGIVAGVLTGLVAWLTSGSFGPGRLADVGPHALVVGAFAALEVGVPAALALAAGSDLVRLPDRGWTGERWHEAESDGTSGADDVARTGSLLAALDQAGAGRTTDVHRFVVEEAHGSSATSAARRPAAGPDRDRDRDDHDDRDRDRDRDSDRDDADRREPVDHVRGRADLDRAAADHEAGPAAAEETDRASRPTADATDHPTDADVELPDWARTDVVAADRVADQERPPARAGLGGIRDRVRGAADGVRGRASALRDRVTGSDGERHGAALSTTEPGAPGVSGESAPASTTRAPGTEPQPAFPWSTAEFVAGRDDVDDPDGPDDDGRSTAHDAPRQSAGPQAAAPARSAGTPTTPRWDATDQIPEDELPWWRKPKSAE